MRAWWMLLLLALLAPGALAQEEEVTPPEAPPKAEEPKEPPAWTLPDRDARKLRGLMEDFLAGDARKQADALKKMEKLLERPIDGHSALEDVASLVDMAMHARAFRSKLKKGHVQEISVSPAVHSFPMGTVKYWLFVPKDYRDDQLWPLMFCLPDNKAHPDGKAFLEGQLGKCPLMAESFLVVVPQAYAKGESWSSPNSLAQAMIALRHATGTFGVDEKEAGPATDFLRIFIHGDDAAAVIAARFPEVFAGAILVHSDGRPGGNIDISAAGQLSGMPAYCIIDPKRKRQREFAERIKADNDVSVIAQDAGGEGDFKSIGEWLEKLPPRASQPRKISYTVHDGSFQRDYWINVLDFDASVEPAPSFEAEANRATNVVTIEVEGISRFELFLNDAIVDLNRPVRIVVKEGDKDLPFFDTEDGCDTVSRDLGGMLAELVESNHPWRIYVAKFVIDVGELRQRAEAEAAAAAGAEGAAAEGASAKGSEQSSSPGK